MGGHGGHGGGHGGGGFRRGGGFVYGGYYPYYDPGPVLEYDDTDDIALIIAGEAPGTPTHKHGKGHHHKHAKKKHAVGAAPIHGDDTATAGATGENEPNYGVFGMDNSLSSSTGGMDPFALADFGDDEEDSASGGKGGSKRTAEPEDRTTEDLPDDLGYPDAFDPLSMTVQDFHFDPHVHAGRVGTKRTSETMFDAPDPALMVADASMPVWGHENDFYSNAQGPAPIMGHDVPIDGPMALIGYDMDEGGMIVGCDTDDIGHDMGQSRALHGHGRSGTRRAGLGK